MVLLKSALRTGWLASAAAAGLCSFASEAQAQDDPSRPTQPQQGEAGAGAEGPVIVVTAQKREENVQDVPVSISVVGGEDLVESGSAQLVDFANYVPGFHVDNLGTPGQSRVALRGISPLGASASVGTYLDDAPIGSSTVYTESAGFTLDLLPYDLARVEVLRGPQGTLYGASTIGGLLKYVTVAPSLRDTTARAGAEAFTIAGAGEIGYAAQGLVNVAASDTLGFTISGAHRRTPGWVDNVQTGDEDVNDFEQTGARSSLLWQPSDAFSLRLSALWQDLSGGPAITNQTPTGAPVGSRDTFSFIDQEFDSQLQIYGASLNYDFGFATLSSTTTYQDAERREFTDASRVFGILFPLLTGGAIAEGITPFEATISLEKWTQEVRLTSPSGGRFEWLIGAFYTDEEASQDQVITSLDQSGAVIAPLNPLAVASLPSTYEEYAFFGNATFRFTERFWLSGGVRWAHNDQTFRQISSGAVIPTADVPGESSESVFTYSVSPQYHFSDRSMIYARVASGYRPGGPNVKLPGVPPSFEADTITNYELGFKTRLIDPSLALDVAVFRMDWEDIQITRSFNGVSGLDNAGTARSEGVEAALLWEPTPGLTFGLNGAYTDAELTEDAPEIGGAAGDRLDRIPELSGSATFNYSFPLGSSAQAEVGGGIRYTGDRVSEVESSPNALTLDEYVALDLNASITLNDRFRIRAYARNITDEGGPVGRELVNDALGRASYINVVTLQPRTIGVALDVNF